MSQPTLHRRHSSLCSALVLAAFAFIALPSVGWKTQLGNRGNVLIKHPYGDLVNFRVGSRLALTWRRHPGEIGWLSA